MIIGISGFARSGKDTVANYLVEHHGFTRMAFADPMKEALYNLDPKINVNGMAGMSLRYAVDSLGWEMLKELSEDIRPLLQRMGTEVGRNLFGQDFWVNQALKKALSSDTPVVLSDVRFSNEALAIRQAHGELWYVQRPGVTAANDHVSETYLPAEIEFDNWIENDQSLDDLYSRVNELVTRVRNQVGETV